MERNNSDRCSTSLSVSSPRTLEQNYGKVLSGVALSGGEALVGPRVELLRRGDLQRVIVLSLDGDMLVGDNELRVPEPGDGELWRTFYGTGEEQGAADASFQVLRRQGHPQRICDGAKQKCWDSKTLPKKGPFLFFFFSLPCLFRVMVK